MRYCVTADTRVETADGTLPHRRPRSRRPSRSRTTPSTSRCSTGSAVRCARRRSSTRASIRRSVFGRARATSSPGRTTIRVLCLVDMVGVPLLLWKRLDEIAAGRSSAARTHGSGQRGLDRRPRTASRRFCSARSSRRAGVSETRGGLQQRRRRVLRRRSRCVRRSSSAARATSRSATIRSGSRLHELDIHNLVAVRASIARAARRVSTSRDKVVPERVWRGGAAFKRIFLQALFTGDGSSSLLPRNTIQISYSTYSEQLAKDVQLLLLEFGVVSRLCRYAKGELKVVITNRRDARLFVLERRLPRCEAARSSKRELAEIPLQSTRAQPRPRPVRRRVHPQPTAARAGSTRTGCAGTTSTGSSAGSAAAPRSWSASPPTRFAPVVEPLVTRRLLLRRGRKRRGRRRAARLLAARRHDRPLVPHERVRQPQHRGAPLAHGDGDAPRHRREHRRLRAELRRVAPRAVGAAVAVPEPARQRLVGHRGRHGDEHAAAPSRRDRSTRSSR